MESFHRYPENPLEQARSARRYVLFTTITLGLYSLLFYYRVGRDLNMIASNHDGRRTLNYLFIGLPVIVLHILGFVVDSEWFIYLNGLMGITMFVWLHMLSSRVRHELDRRQINYDFGARQLWLYYVAVPTALVFAAYTIRFTASDVVFLALIVVSVMVYIHKLCHAMNLLAYDFNNEMTSSKGVFS